LSMASRASAATAAAREASETAPSFSIEGLEHTLLSRGKAPKYARGDVDDSSSSSCGAGGRDGGGRKGRVTDRQQRRAEKKRIRGDPHDFLKVRREGQLCTELWGFAQTTALVKTLSSLVSVLLLLSDGDGEGDRSLARDVQCAIDSFCDALSEHVPVAAPAYPLSWLQGKQMLPLARFQSPPPLGMVGASYAQAAAEGVALWRSPSLRLAVLDENKDN
jgi:hypothetical protein